MGPADAAGGQARQIGLFFAVAVAPQPAPGTGLEIDGGRFFAHCIGRSLTSARIHIVCPHQYRALRLVMQELKPRGYRRPGLVMLRASDERVDRNRTAGLLNEQQALSVFDRVAPLRMEDWNDHKLTAWLLQAKPDVMVTKFVEVQALVQQLGFQVPRDLGTVFPTCPEPGSELCGVYKNPDEVGAAAMDYITGMTHRMNAASPGVAQRSLSKAR